MKRTLQSVILIVVAALSVSAVTPAYNAGGTGIQPLIIYGDSIAPGKSVIVQITNVNGTLVPVTLTNVVRITDTGIADSPPGDVGGDPPTDAALAQVRKAFEDDGKLDIFDQHRTVLAFSLKVSPQMTSTDGAHDSIMSFIDVTVGDYADPHWKPWLDPFITEMKEQTDLAAFVAVVDKARASLGQGE